MLGLKENLVEPYRYKMQERGVIPRGTAPLSKLVSPEASGLNLSSQQKRSLFVSMPVI